MNEASDALSAAVSSAKGVKDATKPLYEVEMEEAKTWVQKLQESVSNAAGYEELSKQVNAARGVLAEFVEAIQEHGAKARVEGAMKVP